MHGPRSHQTCLHQTCLYTKPHIHGRKVMCSGRGRGASRTLQINDFLLDSCFLSCDSLVPLQSGTCIWPYPMGSLCCVMSNVVTTCNTTW